ncbi:tRNA lysidine(34) synthetase TilS [Psychromonas sp. SR45-3]|uniref:tRNA lysidine(34) synthetase TilS n=1 Tax=Psychromonas sp. SR45-3 TaxID=2760930 RepID=UPI0015F855AB|nr:tRNA lysidine(34) synthetase TilS [Psychromonas sp. SR45-3]MBB1271600.1 tRNA lysidine(34) synthetase TilS [Psychromonas sp. SR45-3]
MQVDLFTSFEKHFSELLATLTVTSAESINNDTEHISLGSLKPRIVVALSGGVDSVVLLHLLFRFRQSCVQQSSDYLTLIAHNVNHGLSDNADHWAAFCTAYCQQLDVKLICSQVDIERKSRTSLEALARDARYQCFQEKMQEHDVVVTGHHQDDQLETLLLALKRGSGSTGLQGIRLFQTFFNGYLLRPLLNFSRQQLIDYAHHHHLQWVEDESNLNIDFDRNFIRQQISPLLTARWPAIAQSVSRTAQLCQEQQSLLDEMAEQDLSLCIEERFSQQTLTIAALSKFSEARRNNILRYWLKSNGLQYPSSKQLMVLWDQVALAQSDKQPKLQMPTVAICRYQGQLYIVPNQALSLPVQPILWSGESILWLQVGYLGVNFSQVDSSLSKRYKVQCCLRSHLNTQLTCLPEGRDKKRSIKKLLHEYHVPPWLRDQVVFIVVDGQLLEALGLWRCQVKDIPQMQISQRFC